MTAFLERVKENVAENYYCDNPTFSAVNEPILKLIQIIEIQAAALNAITAKVPEKVSQNEAADMAIEFKMAARKAKIEISRLFPEEKEKT